MWFLFCLNVGCLMFLFFCLFEAASFLSFWFVLELLSLSVVPYFLFWSVGMGQRCLLQYVLVMMLSSFFLVLGVLSYDFRGVFLSVGVLMKLGVFPFMSWVYGVVVFSNWVVIWLISGLLKISFFLLFYYRGLEVSWLLGVLCFLCFLLLGLNFWKSSVSWRYCWCHMMLSGSAGLVVVGLCCPFSVVFYVFLIYFIWSSLVVWYLSLSCHSVLRGLGNLFYFFLLVSFPVSLAVLYKLVLGVSVLFFSLMIFVVWGLYTMSEQLFMVFFFVGGVKVRSVVCLLSCV